MERCYVWGFSSSRYSKYLYTWGSLFLIMNFKIFSCVRTIVCVLITISRFFFGQEKTTIFKVIQFMSHIQYMLLVVPMWDLETSWNFQNWFYSNDKWGWLCVIQYSVWWIVLRYCYTYDIYKISLTETIDFYFSLQYSEYVNFKIFSATLSQSKHASTWAICISA